MNTNQYGLSRDIPDPVMRTVRQNSKFGCVICRSGFYQYEHIDPPFAEARTHDPENICCLCASCHDAVTRRRYSKAFVLSKYREIREKSIEQVLSPTGPLDFHDGTAELVIGGMHYSPAIQTVIRYHGVDIFKVIPGENNTPGKISAVFTDDNGNVLLQIQENEWIGCLESWDIEITGQRFMIRRKKGEIILQFRLDPPGRVVIEKLDMRINDAHILANEMTYAVGRYLNDIDINWMYANIVLKRSSTTGAVIEFADPLDLDSRVRNDWGNPGALANPNEPFYFSPTVGIVAIPIGICIASQCNSFGIGPTVLDVRTLSQMRNWIKTKPDKIANLIAWGEECPNERHEFPNAGIIFGEYHTPVWVEDMNEFEW